MDFPTGISLDHLEMHSNLLADSFHRLVGRPLVETKSHASLAEALFNAPFVVVSHGLEDDPLLNYGNAIALELWEMSWDELTSTPSRQTAEPANQQERAEAMARVKKAGFTEGYSGIRISKSGRRFLINDTVIWNVTTADKIYCGQAATFASWTFL